MKKFAIIFLANVYLLCSCEKEVEADAVAFSKIPETYISEAQLGAEVYTYEDFLRATTGRHYCQDAIYDCYEKKGKTYYIMNRRENYPDNANQLVGMEGILPHHIQIYDGHYTYTGGYDIETNRYDYTFNEATQELSGICTWAVFAEVPKVLVYLSDEYFILQMGTPWKKRTKELGATFSRVVYKSVDKSEVPNCNIIDKSN